jgi:NDP-sugar pyrophosphorylase family protein
MLNIVIPMCGNGQRFKDAGYEDPKPWMPTRGKSMIQAVVDNLSGFVANEAARFILITQNGLVGDIDFGPHGHKVLAVGSTEGAVATLLHARSQMLSNEGLLIANCDQIVDLEPNEWAMPLGMDGSLLTFCEPSRSRAWSYVVKSSNGHIARIVEKKPISSEACVGIYYFRHSHTFMDTALRVVQEERPAVNGEYYTSQVIQRMVDERVDLGTFEVERARVHMIGTPELLRSYNDCAF